MVSVTGNLADAVTLNSTPAVGEGAARIWYLYSISGNNAPTDMVIAPIFVQEQRSSFLDIRYLNASLSLSDIASAVNGRTNLGFTNQTAGQVLYGTGSNDFTSDANFFWNSAGMTLTVKIMAAVSPGSDSIIYENTSGAANNEFGVLYKNTGFAGSARITSLLNAGGGTSQLRFYTGGTPSTIRLILDENGNLYGGATLTYDLGTSGTYWNNLYAANGIFKSLISLEDPGAGTNTVTLQAPAALAASYTLTLPADDGLASQALTTDGAGVLSWTTVGSGTVNTGVVGRLALYPANGTTVDDQYTQNANLIDVLIAPHAALAASRTYTIDEVGASASFVMTEGAQTLNAIKTFSSTPLFKSGIDIEDPGAGANKITVTTGVVSASYSISLPLVQGAANTTLLNDGAGVLSWTLVRLASQGKSGNVTVASAATSKAIAFATTFGSTNYSISCTWLNTVDTSPKQQPFITFVKAATGFTVEWNEALDTANYSIDWTIEAFYDP